MSWPLAFLGAFLVFVGCFFAHLFGSCLREIDVIKMLRTREMNVYTIGLPLVGFVGLLFGLSGSYFVLFSADIDRALMFWLSESIGTCVRLIPGLSAVITSGYLGWYTTD